MLAFAAMIGEKKQVANNRYDHLGSVDKQCHSSKKALYIGMEFQNLLYSWLMPYYYITCAQTGLLAL